MVAQIRARYREEFEQIGPDDVRSRLKAHLYDQEKSEHARRWLDEKDHGEDRSLKRESNQIARSAKNAAWIAATMAIIAVIFAGLSIFLNLKGYTK